MEYKEAIIGYTPYNEQEENDKKKIVTFMNEHEDLLTRANEIAHFTSSAWIVNRNFTKTVMAYHHIYQSWAWAGGHVDGDTDFLQVALKEAAEETGLTQLKPVDPTIFSMEVLDVPAHIKKGKSVPQHSHLNVTYLLEADESERLRIKPDENSAIAWMTLDEAVAKSTEPEMQVVYRKLNEKVRKWGKRG